MNSETVKKLRKKLGMTQDKFADLVEVHKQTVWRWENGTAKVDGPSRKLLEIMCKMHDVEE